MKNYFVAIVIAAALTFAVIIVRQKAQAQNANPQPVSRASEAEVQAGSDTANSQATPIYVTEIPAGYRDWKLISVAHEEGNLNDIRAVLGNDIAIKAYREGKFPFPEGAIIGRIAWSYVSSEENNKSFGRDQSFVAGSPTDSYLQFMVKDSKKYAATGGWGYSSFGKDGKTSAAAAMQTCYPCHQKIESRDFVFTRYSP